MLDWEEAIVDCRGALDKKRIRGGNMDELKVRKTEKPQVVFLLAVLYKFALFTPSRCFSFFNHFPTIVLAQSSPAAVRGLLARTSWAFGNGFCVVNRYAGHIDSARIDQKIVIP